MYTASSCKYTLQARAEELDLDTRIYFKDEQPFLCKETYNSSPSLGFEQKIPKEVPGAEVKVEAAVAQAKKLLEQFFCSVLKAEKLLKKFALWAFLAPKINLQRHLEPSWAPKWKIHKKRNPIFVSCCAYIVLRNSKHQKNTIRFDVTSFL